MQPDMKKASCCSLSRSPGTDTPLAAPNATSGKRIPDDVVRIPRGRSLVGTSRPETPDDGEDPIRNPRVKPFRIEATTVTNAQFAAFFADTNYFIEAERFGLSFVFWMQVPEGLGPTLGVKDVEWWRRVDGANWRDINGPGTMEAAWDPDHPVVHMSWNDAQTYAK